MAGLPEYHTPKRQTTGSRKKSAKKTAPATPATPAIQTPTNNRPTRARKTHPNYIEDSPTNSEDGGAPIGDRVTRFMNSPSTDSDFQLEKHQTPGSPESYGSSILQAAQEDINLLRGIAKPNLNANTAAPSSTSSQGAVSMGPRRTCGPAFKDNARDEDTNMFYKYTICSLLSLDEEWATKLALEDLRLYARAYDKRQAELQWACFCPGTGLTFENDCGPYGFAYRPDGQVLLSEKTGEPAWYHLGQLYHTLGDLADARGDVFDIKYEHKTFDSRISDLADIDAVLGY